MCSVARDGKLGYDRSGSSSCSSSDMLRQCFDVLSAERQSEQLSCLPQLQTVVFGQSLVIGGQQGPLNNDALLRDLKLVSSGAVRR